MPPTRPVDPTSIRLFLAAIEEGSLAKAAARENIVPSAVSKRMSELEETFGVPLLERGIKGVQATPAGQALAFHARTMLQTMDRMHLEMAGFATGVRGHIRLSASVAALSGPLPDDIQAFRLTHPQIDFTLIEHTTHAVFRAVANGEADIAIGSDFGGHEGLQVFPYSACELAAVVPARHLLAEHGTLSYAQLAPFEQIELNRDNGISNMLENAAREAGITRRISARISSHETICTLVERGIGVGVVPLYLKPLHGQSQNIRFIPLTGPWSRTRICIAVRDLAALSPATRAFVAYLGVRA